nr:ribonuclease H [Tanacetum cinerariifolium]
MQSKAVDPSHYRVKSTYMQLKARTCSQKPLIHHIIVSKAVDPSHYRARYQARPTEKHVEQGVIELYFVNTEYQLADLFTKALGRDRIEFLTNKLGMRSFTPETLKKLMNEDDE